MRTAGQRLRAWREGKHLSQKVAAEMIGSLQGTWSAWENDRKLPDIAAAIKIAKLTKRACPVEMWATRAWRTGTEG